MWATVMAMTKRSASATSNGQCFGWMLNVSPALVAPALKFHQAIALARRVALRQGQAARLGEDAAEEDRLVVDVELVPSRDVHERRVADIGPGD